MVKICSNCGQRLHENTMLCPDCGSTEFTVEQGDVQDYQINENIVTMRDINGNGNILMGVVGAFLFSLLGGVAYFVVHQFGFVAGICGFIIFYLAGLGYKKFSKCNNSISIGGLVSSIAMMVVMIFVAHYASCAFDIYQAYQEIGFVEVTFIDAINLLTESLADEEYLSLFVSDLLWAYGFGIFATISDIVRIIKARR